MSKVVGIEKALARKTLKEVKSLLDQVYNSFNLVEDNLAKPAFKVNLVILVSKLIMEEVQPAIQNINKVRVKAVSLERYNLDKKALRELIYSIDCLYAFVVQMKKSLEKVTERSNAQLLVQVAVKEQIIPALQQLVSVFDNYNAVMKSVSKM